MRMLPFLRLRFAFCRVGAVVLIATVAGCSSSASSSGAVSASTPGTASAAQQPSISVAGDTTVRLGATSQFSATVTGDTTSTVVWSVNGIVGGEATDGIISAAGLYTAPVALPASGRVTVTASITSATATAGSTLRITLGNPLPVVTSATATQVGSSLNYTVDVKGSGFLTSSVLSVGGTPQTITLISASELQATVQVAAGTTSVAITVANPDPGAAGSGTLNIPVTQIGASLSAAARLLDQSTFGPTASAIQHVQQVGLDTYLSEQFRQPTTPLAAIPVNPLPAVCLAGNSADPCAESEWWNVALNGPDQLRQRVAFALSEMFVVSTQMVPGQAIPSFHNALANDAFGNFSTLMKDVTLSSAMGAYLNMLNSAKPVSGQIANENYSRELMQLFTVGLYQLNQDGTPQLDGSGNMIPAYTQAQVQAFARAYTGWTLATAGGAAVTKFPNNSGDYDDPMVAVNTQHDTTQKVLLSTTLPAGQTAAQDLTGALTDIFDNSNVGPFVCKQLIQHLVTSTPSPAYVARVSAIFANNGSGVRGDLKAVIRAILMDSEARAGDMNASFDGGHLREPILFLTAMVRGLGFTNTDVNSSYASLSNYSNNLSERPYRANSVFNFFPPDYVIPGSTLNAPEFGIENTATAVLRLSLADSLVNNRISGFAVDLSNTSALGIMAANPANLVDTLSTLFMYSQMPDGMRSTIISAITPLTSNAQRVRVAVYLIVTSSQYKVIH